MTCPRRAAVIGKYDSARARSVTLFGITLSGLQWLTLALFLLSLALTDHWHNGQPLVDALL